MVMQSVYIGNGDGTSTSVDKLLDHYEKWLGHETDGIQVHTGYANWWDWTNSISWAASLNKNINADHQVFWSVPLIPRSEATMTAAARGDYDAKYVKAAQDLLSASSGSDTIYVRTGWEFNAYWSPASSSAVGQASAYVGAFQNFVDAFRSVSDRFKFEWTPNIGNDGSIDPETAYPGDKYVDIIGMDFYWDAKQSWSIKDPIQAWNYMLTEKNGLNWLASFAGAHGKPIAIAEWGVNSDNAAPFIAKAVQWFQDHNVLYESYWNSNAAFDGQIDSGQYPHAAEAYREFMGSLFEHAHPVDNGGTALNNIEGTVGVDTLVGTDKNDKIDGHGGADTMIGGKGDDTYYISGNGGDGFEKIIEKAGEGIDTVISLAHYTTLAANVENLVLATSYVASNGVAGEQTGTGNELDNKIVGGKGNNIINGMGGNDWMTGGGGKDVFIIQANSGKDTITDFKNGEDFVKLEVADFKTFADVQENLYQNGTSVVLNLGNGNELWFDNHKIADFTSADFVFTGMPVGPSMFDVVNSTNGTVTWQGGTAYGETILGDDRNNYMFSGGNKLGGIDTMIGGKGNDVYNISSGTEIIVEKSGEGTDTVESWAGKYTLAPNVENLNLMSATYAQNGTGNEIDNVINGTAAVNKLYGMDGNDKLYGMAGNDVLDGGNGNDRLFGGTGDDTLTGGAGNDVFVFVKGDGKDVITDFSVVADKVELKEGFALKPADILSKLSQVGNNVVLTLGSDQTVTFNNTKVASFTAANFTGIGVVTGPVLPSLPAEAKASAAFQTWIQGTSGADTIIGDDKNNSISNMGGNDILKGGKGDDTYNDIQGTETIVELANQGIDTVTAWSRSYTLGANVENLNILGGYLQSGTGNELANRITGGAADNIITGKAGNDWIVTGGGNDVVVFAKGDGHDVVTDFSSTDKVMLQAFTGLTQANISSHLYAQGNNVVLYLDEQNSIHFLNKSVSDFKAENFQFDNITGTTGNDKYTVITGHEIITEAASGGTDTVYSYADSYTLSANVENAFLMKDEWQTQTLNGNALNNTITGGKGYDTLSGLDGNDILYGMEGNDVLLGGNGNDKLVGGAGSDTLYGGSGADLFVFDRAGLGSVDTIKDFNKAEGDKIVLDHILEGFNPATKAIADFVQITTSGSNTIVKVDTDGAANGHVWTQIATIQGVTGLGEAETLHHNGTLTIA